MPMGSETGESELILHNVSRRLRKCSLILLAISLLCLLLVTSYNPVVHGESTGTYLSFTPPMYLATETGELFNITIDVSNVGSLRSASFVVAYNASLLDVEQVLQGQFFPLPPRSYFEFEKDETLGLVKISMSLAGSESPRSGDGTLACIRFRVATSPEFPVNSPIELQQTSLLDSTTNLIPHDMIGAVYFWKSIQPDMSIEGRTIDLYTQKGGVGQDVPDGQFTFGELVRLTSFVTYNNYPVSLKLVAIEVRNPLNEVVLVGVVVTDQNGYAELDFRIPFLSSSIGEWSVVATVDIAERVVWDTLRFQVSPTSLVGGYSVQIGIEAKAKPLTPYMTLLTILGSGFIIIKRKTSRKSRMTRDFNEQERAPQSLSDSQGACSRNNTEGR